MDGALFDAAFASLQAESVLEQRGERVRPGDIAWEAPPEMLRALEGVERELEAAGYLVPEVGTWQPKLGAAASEVVAMGFFLGRLVRVTQELTYTNAQLERLRATLREWFATHAELTVADFRDITGASRKFAVPLLEYADRVGWTVRGGDARRAGGGKG